MNLKKLQNLDVTGKRVLLRIDLNLPYRHGKITDTTRITRTLPTIQYLIAKKAKIIILSHFGRPNGKFDLELSLAPIVAELERHIGKTVKFCTETIGLPAESAINRLSPGEILLLENLRFYVGEITNDIGFAKNLAELGDIFVCDAFSCAHRKHASICAIAQLLPSAAGFLLQDELINIEKLLSKPERPLTAIIGGAKTSTKLELLSSLLSKIDTLFIGGAMANTFLMAKGMNIGSSLHEPHLIPAAKRILTQAKDVGKTLILPTDFIVKSNDNDMVQIHEWKSQLLNSECILDVGPKTLNSLYNIIHTSKSLIWNGPLGVFEDIPFEVSTLAVARIIASSTMQGDLYSIAGGGDTVAAIKAARLLNSFSHISTGGGAFLEWLEGKVLLGVTALMDS